MIPSDEDKIALAWIEWWMSHHERDQRLGGTLTLALMHLREMMGRWAVARTAIDTEV